MGKDWTDASHVGKVGLAVMEVMAKEFFIEAKLKDKDFNKMVKLSQAVGYQSQLYSALQKSHEMTRRINNLEKALERDPELIMLDSPVLTAEQQLSELEKGV